VAKARRTRTDVSRPPSVTDSDVAWTIAGGVREERYSGPRRCHWLGPPECASVRSNFDVTRCFGSRGAAAAARFLSSDSSSKSETENELPTLVYEDTFIKEVLSEIRTIAMVGASPNWNRPSYFAMKYLQGNVYIFLMYHA
jgi:hypothetical protein